MQAVLSLKKTLFTETFKISEFQLSKFKLLNPLWSIYLTPVILILTTQ